MGTHLRFKDSAIINQGSIEDVYVDLTDKAAGTPLTDLADATSVAFDTYDSSHAIVAALSGDCTTDGMTAVALLDTTDETAIPGLYNLFIIITVTDDDAEVIRAGPYPFKIVAN